MSDYSDNIKRIVGIKDVEDRLKELENKNPIPGQRGIAYMVNGAVQSASGVSSTVAGANGAVTSAINAAKASAGQASTSGDRTGGGNGGEKVTSDAAAEALAGLSLDTVGVKGSEDGVFDAEDYFGTNLGLGYLADTGLRETLSGLTGFTDCDSGKNVNVRFDGMYIPPADRQTADEGIIFDGFEQGHVWEVSGQGVFFSTAEEAGRWWVDFGLGALTNPVFNNISDIVEFGGQFTAFANYSSDSSPDFQVNLETASCTVGVDANCPTEQPVSYIWPISDTFQMVNAKYDPVTGAALRSATFQAHPNDPNVSAGFAGETSNMNLCFGAGRIANIQANNLGGNIVREVSSVDGSQIGAARIYDSKNVLIGYSDAAGLSNYLPN